MGAAGFVSVAGIAGIIHRKKKKLFSFVALTPSQMWLKRPVYRGFKGEGRCEGRAFALTLTLTLPSHFRQECILSGIPWMSEAAVYREYAYE